MSLRICLGLLSVVLLSSMSAACGGDVVTPPIDVDAGSTDLGGADAGPGDAAIDAQGVDAGACPDVDGDGHGTASCDDDCDDDDASRYPGATETCDGDDEDCDDTTYGPDGDGDTFVSVACCNGAGNCGTDCDDAAVNINPSGTEVCNGGIDDDCNGAADLADGVCVPCAVGYTGFDGECTDVNECTTGAPCGAAAGAMCVNSPPGSYTCSCPAGYRAPTAGGTCTDIDECAEATCGVGVSGCVNSAGSYTCMCAAGYTATGTGAPCVDIEECLLGTPCGAGVGTCENRLGTYACTCDPGYEGPATGGLCADTDECARGTDDCDDVPDACTNTDGGFTCVCPAWFLGTGRGASGCTTRLTDLGNGTVRDNATGLVWQQSFNPVGLNRADSAAYCASLTVAGNGWRLPTLDELRSIVDTRFYNPTIDLSFFPGTTSVSFWSSSLFAGSSTIGWVVFFYTGGAAEYDVAYGFGVRCVR